MTTLDGAICLPASEPPFVAKMWEAIQTAQPLEGALSPWPMRRIITTLYEGLLHLKALGRTPAQICEFLTEYSGLGITPSTLATYLSREKHQRQGKPGSPPSLPQSSSVRTAESASATLGLPSPAQATPEPVEPQSVESSAVQSVQRQPVDTHRAHQAHPEQVGARSTGSLDAETSSSLAPPLPSSATAVNPAPVPKADRTVRFRRKPKPWRTEEPDNPPAPESFLNEPTFNTIERN